MFEVRVDLGAVAWPTGADLAPDAFRGLRRVDPRVVRNPPRQHPPRPALHRIEWRRSHLRPGTPTRRHTAQKQCVGVVPQGGDGGAGRAERRIAPGPGSTTTRIQEAQRPERSEGLASPTNHPPSIAPTPRPRVRAAEAAAGAAGTAPCQTTRPVTSRRSASQASRFLRPQGP